MGRRPIKDFLEALDDDDAASIAGAMKEVREQGISASRHLRGENYEVRADGRAQSFRILFSQEGEHSHVLLALTALSKKTQKTPSAQIELAEKRLQDWRDRVSK